MRESSNDLNLHKQELEKEQTKPKVSVSPVTNTSLGYLAHTGTIVRLTGYKFTLVRDDTL